MKIRSALICRLSYVALLLAAGAGCTPTTSNDNPDGGGSGDDGGNPSSNTGPDAGTGSDAGTTGENEAGSTDGGNDASGGGSTPDGGGPDAATVMVPVMTPNGPTPPASLTGTTITGNACTISSATTWPAGVYDINCSNELEIDSVLTIDQGAIIKFEANNYVRVSATGTLDAIGGPTTPIVFTSIKDDAHGGDTNGDGSATSPKAGDWAGIQLQGTNNSTLSECAFEYQGGPSGAVVDSSAAPVTVTNSVFAHNRPTTDSITSAPALDLSGAPAGNVVQGNVFYDNGVPIDINGNSSLDDTNSFDNSAAAPDNPQPNEYNGIVVDTGPDIDGHISWGTTKVPYVLTEGYLEIESTGTLSLADGVTVKFSSGTSLSRGRRAVVAREQRDRAHLDQGRRARGRHQRRRLGHDAHGRRLEGRGAGEQHRLAFQQDRLLLRRWRARAPRSTWAAPPR